MNQPETLENRDVSREMLKAIIEAQRTHIRNLEHERDLLAVGYRAAVERCNALEAGAGGQLPQPPSTPKD